MLAKAFNRISANKFRLINTAKRGVYTTETKPHVFINEHTKVIVQGMTGKHGTFHTKASIEYGTKVVAGVNARKAGTEHLGLPVFANVTEAKKHTDADACAVYVPPPFAADAILEAV